VRVLNNFVMISKELWRSYRWSELTS